MSKSILDMCKDHLNMRKDPKEMHKEPLEMIKSSLEMCKDPLEIRKDCSYTVKTLVRTVSSDISQEDASCSRMLMARPKFFTIKYLHGAHQSSLLLLTIILLSRLFLSAASQDGLITCECSANACKDSDDQTCTTYVGCYSQFLAQRDGSHPITRGCLSAGAKNSLLCMNRRPAVHGEEWPSLVCCYDNLCNRDVIPTPSSSMKYIQDEETESLQRLGVSSIEEFRQKYDREVPQDYAYDQQNVYLLVIIAALVFMIAVTAIGSCLLLNYRSKYSRALQYPIETTAKKKKKKKKIKMLSAGVTTQPLNV